MKCDLLFQFYDSAKADTLTFILYENRYIIEWLYKTHLAQRINNISSASTSEIQIKSLTLQNLFEKS